MAEDPKSSPEQAAQELTLAVIAAAGDKLIGAKANDADDGQRVGRFVNALHAEITAHLKSLDD